MSTPVTPSTIFGSRSTTCRTSVVSLLTPTSPDPLETIVSLVACDNGAAISAATYQQSEQTNVGDKTAVRTQQIHIRPHKYKSLRIFVHTCSLSILRVGAMRLGCAVRHKNASYAAHVFCWNLHVYRPTVGFKRLIVYKTRSVIPPCLTFVAYSFQFGSIGSQFLTAERRPILSQLQWRI